MPPMAMAPTPAFSNQVAAVQSNVQFGHQSSSVMPGAEDGGHLWMNNSDYASGYSLGVDWGTSGVRLAVFRRDKGVTVLRDEYDNCEMPTDVCFTDKVSAVCDVDS